MKIEELKKDFDTTDTGNTKSQIKSDVLNIKTLNDNDIIHENNYKSKEYLSYSCVKEKELDWLWKNYIIKGNLNIIVGDAGVGKSYLTSWLVSAISKGDKIPFSDENFSVGNSILQNGEDDLGATVKPRMLSNNANIDKIYYLNETENDLTIQQIDRLEDIIKKIKPELIILDPLQAYIGDVNINSTVEVRNALKPLKQLAERHNCAIVMLMHLNKNTGTNKATNRVMGSYDFIAICRSALLITVNPDNEEEKLLIPIKTNLLKENEKNSLAFRINNDGQIEWLENKGKISADDILSQNNNFTDKISYTKGFIIGALSNNDLTGEKLRDLSLKHGINIKCFNVTRAELSNKEIFKYQKEKKHWWSLKDRSNESKG